MRSFEGTQIVKIAVKMLTHTAMIDVTKHQEVAHVMSLF